MSQIKNTLFKNVPWQSVGAVGATVALVAVVAFFTSAKPAVVGANLGLSASALNAYNDALSLASTQQDPDAAVARLDSEISTVPSKSAELNDLYTEAKLTIYKADIILTYTQNIEGGFGLLGQVYANPEYNDAVKGEALMLAMAHSLQGLDEGRITAAEIRDYVLLNNDFSGVLGVDQSTAAAIESPEDTYKYLAVGFAAAVEINPSEKVGRLAESYSLRLLAPFIVPPPTGGYYHSFVASIEGAESQLDTIKETSVSQNLPYQEFIPTSYYNLARAYEALPSGDIDQVESMARIHVKLAEYISQYPDSSFGTFAYLTGISTRLVCKAVSLAGYDVSLVDKNKIQPYLDEIYSSEGWVVPCKEAFEFVAKNIDPRFAKYF